MKLTSLHIKNFRVLEDFKVKKLGRVNLIVGKNNSGKSTVLEALRIYAGNANRLLLTEIADDHDEKYQMSNKERENDDGALPFESFFTGRCFPDNEAEAILIGSTENSSDSLRLHHAYMGIIEEKFIDEDGTERVRMRRKQIPKLDLHGEQNGNIFHAIRVSKNNKTFVIYLDDPLRPRGLLRGSLDETIETFASRGLLLGSLGETIETFPCSYIPTQFVSLDELADEWDKIIFTEYERSTRTVLKFIDDDFENIAFVKNKDFKGNFKRSAKVKMACIKKPVPLNSMGDGMLRVLQLAIKVFPAKGGFLLIDEFENGLHFSVQEKVWNWLFNLAKQLNIQVFATTHSWDCVESFIKVARKEKDSEGVLFRVGRSVRTSDKDKIIATEFDDLAVITQSDVEVR